MKRCRGHIITSIFVLTCLSIFSACVDTKKAVYFNNIRDTIFYDAVKTTQHVIQRNDLLSISVSSLNPEASAIFNTPNNPTVSASTATGNISQMTGYLVDQDGNIHFPILGTVKAGGLTMKQLTDVISSGLVERKLLIDPIVNVRFLNFKVTVLGEVGRPTVITVANEKISILEALGIAGDLGIYSKRDQILLIREENGNKIVKRLNLNGTDILTSPYYYLKTNDIVYAEPNNTRLASSSAARQILPVILSGLSLIAVILFRVSNL